MPKAVSKNLRPELMGRIDWFPNPIKKEEKKSKTIGTQFEEELEVRVRDNAVQTDIEESRLRRYQQTIVELSDRIAGLKEREAQRLDEKKKEKKKTAKKK